MEQSTIQAGGRPSLSSLPNSTAVLTLGIVSIAAGGCFGLIGLATGIIALVLAGKSEKEYAARFGQYSPSSYKNMKAGKICAIIGTCIGAVKVTCCLLYIFIAGTVFSFIIPWKVIFNFPG